jgi:hypothetical protein
MDEHAFIFVINFIKIWLLEILYNELLGTRWCGQVYCVDLPLRIHTGFISHFLSFILFSMQFRIFAPFSRNKKNETKSKMGSTVMGRLSAHGLAYWPSPVGKTAGYPALAHGRAVRPDRAVTTHCHSQWPGRCGSSKAARSMRSSGRALPRCGLSAEQLERRHNSPCQWGGMEVVAQRLFLGGGWWPTVGDDSWGTL